MGERVYTDYFVQGTEPTQECDGTLMGPESDSLFALPSGILPGVVPAAPNARTRRVPGDSANPFRLP